MRFVRVLAGVALLAALTGCVVVPAEPVVYAPAAPAAVVVQPTYGYSYHGYRRHPHRHRHYWRY